MSDRDAHGRWRLASTTGALWTRGDAGGHWHGISIDPPPIAVLRFAAG